MNVIETAVKKLIEKKPLELAFAGLAADTLIYCIRTTAPQMPIDLFLKTLVAHFLALIFIGIIYSKAVDACFHRRGAGWHTKEFFIIFGAAYLAKSPFAAIAKIVAIFLAMPAVVTIVHYGFYLLLMWAGAYAIKYVYEKPMFKAWVGAVASIIIYAGAIYSLGFIAS
ncbi:MAG: hypothetical protein NTW04_03430, partial [Elusimicrobia bacterium]|nr:hypothetical protein [Elusimicrobiota bacterium]